MGLSGREFLKKIKWEGNSTLRVVVPVNEWLRHKEIPGKYTVAKMKKNVKETVEEYISEINRKGS